MTTPPPVTENLWLKAIRTYWSDPKNLIGPPGALVRRLFKCLWLLLSVYVLFWIAGPSQVASWRLWMGDDELATHIVWGFTFASALCFAIVGYVAAESEPLKIPLIVPTVEFEERKYKGWKIKPMHLHLPNIRVGLGSLLALGLFAIALLGMWNFYLHEQQQTGGASVAALSGSTSRVEEAERALADFEQRTAQSQAAITAAIAATPAGSPTGRSRLVRQQAEALRQASEERRQLQSELREARAATVTTRTEFADPRPVDGQVAAVTGAPRGVVAATLDLLRSGIVEALLVMGAGLGLAGATSRIGVPPISRETPGNNTEETVTVAETTAAPEAPVTPEPKRRFTLPPAEDEDYRRAAAIGPLAWASAGEAEQEAPSEPPDETAATEAAAATAEPMPEGPAEAPEFETAEQEQAIDPLMAAHLHNEEPANV